MSSAKARFALIDVGRFLLAHLIAAIAAGLAFTLVRVGLALPSPPGLGPISLLWFLAAVQCVMVGGAAAIFAVALSARMPKAAGLIFPAAGVGVALLLAAIVDQLNATFLAPAAAAGLVFGVALFRLAWRPAVEAG